MKSNVFMDSCAARDTGSCRLRADASIMLIGRLAFAVNFGRCLQK